VGLTANHGKTLHIVAHSMGGLVSRSFIEQHDGNKIVQHLIMLGTPNAGSPWSTVQDLAITALTIGLNGLSLSGFPFAAIGNLLGLIETIDINLDEMKPNSDFLTTLASSSDPNIPYTILAGNTSLIPPPDQETANKIQKLWEKIGEGAVNFPFFGQPNDLAVTVHSIKAIPSGRSLSPTIQEVACDHLVYFTHPDGLEALAKAVIDTGILQSNPNDNSNENSLQPIPNFDENVIPIRPNTEAAGKTQMWVVGVIVMMIFLAVGSFWIWYKFNQDRPEKQENSSWVLPSKYFS
jgi:pimeloyl-ACP methyl ester carboxylesterase